MTNCCGAPADQSFGARSRNAALSLCLVAGWQAGRPDKVWRAARRLQQKLNLRKVARSVLPAHVLGVATPLFPERRWFLPGHLIIFATPLFVIPTLQPAGENRNARPSIGQRTADDRPLIRQLIIFRTAVPVLSSAGSLLRPDSAGSLLFSWPRDLRNLHTRVSSSRKLPYASPETQQE